jgi:sarcosine oxidase, subunit gamma
MPVSAPDTRGVEIARCAADVIELAAFASASAALEELAAHQGVRLAGLGRHSPGEGLLTLSVRPGRWLLLSPPEAPGSAAARWQEALSGRGAAVDLSCALAAFVVGGPAAREMLARGCRLDLDRDAFPPGRAAATIMVQVPVTLAAVGSALLLLTPATTARHLNEWLSGASRPFGLRIGEELSVRQLFGARPA